jgi:tetratricopeptide (TPR) repeat protein
MNPAEDDDDESSTFSKDQQKDSQTSRIRMSLEWKERGNAHYGKREFEEAATAYQSGIDALPVSPKPNNDNDYEDLAVALRSNLAIALIKLEQFDRADQECTAILESHAPNTKGMYSMY